MLLTNEAPQRSYLNDQPSSVVVNEEVGMSSIASKWIGSSGRQYVFKQLIQERPQIGRVWLATCVRSHHSGVTIVTRTLFLNLYLKPFT